MIFKEGDRCVVVKPDVAMDVPPSSDVVGRYVVVEFYLGPDYIGAGPYGGQVVVHHAHVVRLVSDGHLVVSGYCLRKIDPPPAPELKRLMESLNDKESEKCYT